jgi:ATP-binding cassette subfamily C protein CydC
MISKPTGNLKYWLLRILRWDPKTILYGVLLAVIAALSGIALLMLSGWFITATAATGVALAAGLTHKLDIYLPGSGIRFFALSRTIGRYAERLYNHNAVLTLIATLRQQLFLGLTQLPKHQLKRTQNSEWLSKLTADLDSLDNILLNMLIPPAVGLIVTLVIGLFLMFFWPLLALILTLSLIVICVLTATLTIKTSQVDSYQTAQLLNHARSQAIEHLQGQLVLQSMHANDQHQQQLINTIEEFGAVQNRLKKRLENSQLIHSVLLGLCLIAISLLAFIGFQNTYFNGPMAILVILACVGVVELLQNLPTQFSQWGKTEFAAQRLRPLAEQSTKLAQTNKPTMATQFAGMQNLRCLRLTLAGHPYIPTSIDRPIDINLGSSDKLLVLGKSGRGKSTLSDLLCGQADTSQFKQTQCQVLINQQPLTDNNLPQWQQQLGYLTQRNAILADTLYANLSLGMHDLNDEQIFAALDLVELGDWARALPDQLDTWLGDTGNKLSGGQARRLCLARLILKSPPLLVLDEPFNGVDNNMATTIWAKLQPWLQDKCVVLLMHERPVFWAKSSTKNSHKITELTL